MSFNQANSKSLKAIYISLLGGSVLILVLQYLGLFNFSSTAFTAPPPSGSLTVTIFEDNNGDGSLGSGEATRLSNVPVAIFDADDNSGPACATAVTDASGVVTFSPADLTGCSSAEVRLEIDSTGYPMGYFVGPTNTVDNDANPATSSYADDPADASPTTQIVDLSADQSVNIGTISPANYQCSPEDAYLMVPCYINGDPLANGASGDLDSVVGFPYTAQGSAYDPEDPANPINVIEPDHLALGQDTGSTWGLAWSQQDQIVYNSAFLKRHVGLGPLGLDGIYAIDMSAGGDAATITNWLEIEDDLGVDMGQSLVPSNINRGLISDTVPSYDTAVFNLIGTIGMGDIDIVDDEMLDPAGIEFNGWVDHEYLFISDVNNKNILVIDTETKGLVSTIDIPAPTPACTNGEHRPWATKYEDGKLFVGVVCDGSTDTANFANPDPNPNLEAIVYSYDLVPELSAVTPPTIVTTPPTVVLRNQLDYAKGGAWNAFDCPVTSGWHAWATTANPQPTIEFSTSNQICWPTPILADLEFTDEGNMLISFVDRTTHQWGFFNLGLDTASPDLYETFSGGDLLMACPNGAGGFDLENDGQCGGLNSNASAGNNHGPGGREFFYGDAWQSEFGGHQETANGGIAYLKGSSEVAVAGMDPWGNPYFSSAGMNWFDTTTGDPRDPGFMLFSSGNSDSPVITPGTQGKAGGLGDVELFCPNIPQQLGNYVWYDTDGDGVQDPDEIPLAGVTVYMELPDGTIVSTVTDENGFYSFDVPANETVTLAFDTSTSTTVLPGGVPVADLPPTLTDGPDATDGNDSDIAPDTGLTIGGNPLPGVTVPTGRPGESVPDVDAGFFAEYDLALIKIVNPGQPPQVTNGGVVDFTITVANQGDVNSGEFSVRESVPAGMSFVAAVGTEWGCAPIAGEAGEFICTFIGDLVPGETTDLIVQLRVDDVGQAPFRNWAEIETDSSDDIGGSDKDSDPGDNDADGQTGSDPVIDHNDIDHDDEPYDERTEDEDDSDYADVDPGPLVSIGNLVFVDSDNDGLFEPQNGEFGIGGVVVELLDQDGNVIATTTTDSNGNYLFENLPPGTYFVSIPNPPAAYPASSDPTSTSDNNVDNDDNGIQINPGDPVISPPIVLSPNGEPTDDGDNDPNSDLTIDFGFYDPIEEPTAITLISFSGRSDNKTVTLTWNTAAEVDNFGFYILRTTTPIMPDPIDLTQAIGFVETNIEKGTVAGSSYTFEDEVDDYGTYYYWLVDVEYDEDTNIEPRPVRVVVSRFKLLFLPFINN